MDGAIFEAWVARCLAPSLGPGDIVIMDNLPAHKVAGVIAAITATGAEPIFLPSYSPDLDPIEQTFSKLEALLRAAAERSIDGPWRRIGTCLDQFSAAERANYFQNSGYRSI